MQWGACAYPGVFMEGILDPVVEEARLAFERAEEAEVAAFELGADGQEMRSPMRIASAPAGDRLSALHRHPEAVATASSLAGRDLEPSECGYIFYRTGDFIGLHRDLPSCEFVLLTALFGEAPALVVYPALMETPAEALLSLARDFQGAPAGGQTVEFSERGLVALDGIIAPHQTPPTGGGRPAGLATLCYRERA